MVLRTIITWLIGVPAAVVIFAFILIAAVIDKSGNGVHTLSGLWTGIVLRLGGIRVKVEGAENLPPAPMLLAPNHLGTFDIPVLQTHLPVQFRWMAKRSLFSLPIIGWAMRLCGYIPIDIGRASMAMKSLNAAADRIRKGTSVLVFPEGSRNRSETLMPFKRGAFYLAVESGVPIVPIGITGTRDIMKVGGFVIRPSDVRVIIGKPIGSEGRSEAELKDLTRAAIEDLLGRAPTGSKTPPKSP